MDLNTLDVILRIIQVVVLPFLVFLVKLLLDQRKQLADLDRRVSKTEACLESVPNENVLHELALSIEGLRGDLKVVTEKIDGLEKVVSRVERVVGRHDEFLLNGGAK